jgi:Dolichyl-phosphate-mannose-protein mannosyltransferase
MDSATLQTHTGPEGGQAADLRKIILHSAIFFLLACFVLFSGMTLRPNMYDEGIILTGAMRVAAGQIPHRDFYANYGPAQFYLLAGLFKLFGRSVLLERLLDLSFKALTVASVYAIAASYLNRTIAACVALLTLIYFLGVFSVLCSYPTTAASLFNLVGTALIVPVFARPVSRRRMFAAGAIAGVATLFRYDTGIALLGIHACLTAIGVSTRCKTNRVRAILSTFWPYLPGFVIVTLPALFYFVSVAHLQSVMQDLLFVARNYRRGRSLPFPPISMKHLENVAIYLPIAALGLSAYLLLADRRAVPDSKASTSAIPSLAEYRGFLICFALLTTAMFFKGLVRTGIIMMFLSILPSMLVTAALYERRSAFSKPLRISVLSVAWLFVLTAGWCSLHYIKDQKRLHASLAESLWSSARGTVPSSRASWCRTSNAATRGLCFFPEDDRLQTIEFIDSHTRPDQTLFVGDSRHDKIFANDNFTYFAAERLPATRWSHFDPDLQDRFDIQTQMVHELETSRPPYVVLDSEFELLNEPNDSSRSSGVTVLDDYLHKNYRYDRSYGTMSIWQRIPAS